MSKNLLITETTCNLFDDDKGSAYISRANPLVKGAYVDVDFAKPVVIDEIILTTRASIPDATR